ncbi:MAG: hypothetical protein DWP98_06610 [Bacteroidetes bacterium]|nr:MAG: hypothetical protein DWP98_06610 [Bacteroidota bacterium]MBL1144454.1 hypothetical protein [Bacteroidota bacterium]MCB0803809.1 hypothetical protein [Flavobacteriales bacterium]NOG57249.1 hypothetical protein [Bacteroidota bacterium]
MEDYTIARVIHVLAVVMWIGGVSMVTTVLIPAIKKLKSKEEQIDTFEKIEGRFAFQAKITTLLTGLSGFYMLYVIDGWHRYFELQYWWLHAMTFVWIIFTLILFVFEPYFLHKIFRTYAEKNPAKTFSFMHKAHIILLTISFITIIGSVAGSHALFFIK